MKRYSFNTDENGMDRRMEAPDGDFVRISEMLEDPTNVLYGITLPHFMKIIHTLKSLGIDPYQPDFSTIVEHRLGMKIRYPEGVIS